MACCSTSQVQLFVTCDKEAFSSVFQAAAAVCQKSADLPAEPPRTEFVLDLDEGFEWTVISSVFREKAMAVHYVAFALRTPLPSSLAS